MTLRAMVRRATPPVLVDLARKWRGASDGGGLTGDYRSWAEALAASSGYDNPAILHKTKAALLKVKSGQAAYERDSVLFDRAEYSWPALAGLLWAAARAGGRLDVLDFGGSLGSSYFQHRAFLRELPHVRWNIVEQPAHVDEGRRSFENEHLRFYRSIGECLSEAAPNVVLLSSVLQYLEHPYEVLTELLAVPCACLIIDRTPYWQGDRDRVRVQRADPEIFDATLPSWVFSRPKFTAYAARHAVVLAEFDALDKLAGLEYKGFILRPAGVLESTPRSR